MYTDDGVQSNEQDPPSDNDGNKNNEETDGILFQIICHCSFHHLHKVYTDFI